MPRPARLALRALGLLAVLYVATLLVVLLYGRTGSDAFPEKCRRNTNCTRVADTQNRGEGLQPLRLDTDVATAKAAVVEWIQSQPRTRIEKADDGHVHAVFRSLVFRFPDDFHVQLRCDGDQTVLWVHSEARLGRRDFNVNEERVQSFFEHMRGLTLPERTCA